MNLISNINKNFGRFPRVSWIKQAHKRLSEVFELNDIWPILSLNIEQISGGLIEKCSG